MSGPSVSPGVTTPGSFANPLRIAPHVRGAYTLSSPDTPGMPAPSDKTAWDFLPQGWSTWEDQTTGDGQAHDDGAARFSGQRSEIQKTITFTQGDDTQRTVVYPADFEPITQLENARLGAITIPPKADREIADCASRSRRRTSRAGSCRND